MNRAELRVWEAYATGTTVDLLGDEVSGGVISQLLLGGCETRTGFVPAVRIKNARVTGRIDVTGGEVCCEVLLEDCVFDEAPLFANARTKDLSLVRCQMPGFDGGGLRADGYLVLAGSHSDGQVHLLGARLRGLGLDDTRICSQDGRFGFFGDGMVIESGMLARRAEITDGMRMIGAQITGGLFLQNTILSNPGALALDASGILADKVECSHGFSADGRVKFRNAQIAGTLSFDRAGKLHNPGHVALHLSRMQVDELRLRTTEPITGIVALDYSRIGVLFDNGPDTWPAELQLPGTVYESLHGPGSRQRIDWISRDPGGFRPQPYEQLSAWYLRDGDERMARKTQLMKFRRRRKLLPWPSRTWSALLDYTVGYGFRPWLVAGWLAVVIAIGTVIFSAVEPRPLKEPAEQPDFNALAYVVDLIVPIGAFGQREAWDAVGWTQWLAYGIIAAGWILATALIAGVTRVLKPN